MKHPKIKILGFLLLSFLWMSGIIDLDNLFNYSVSNIPASIDASIDSVPPDNLMDDRVATLGRVLFYDKKLSANNSVSCASCHQQEFAFGVEELQGTGVNGLTSRRPMRLLNLRILKTPLVGHFWDERTVSLEELATQPIRDHVEMGYSGQQSDPDFDDLIIQLEGVNYYDQLFTFAFGTNEIAEGKIAKALAQFVRSIESYDSKFDAGFQMVGGTPFNGNIGLDFPNFTIEENAGKTLFVSDALKDINGVRIGGGLGCFNCHSVPSFNYISASGNNGVITEIDSSEVLDITKAPSLRDVFGPNGTLNGPLFHNGQANDFNEILNHYNQVSSTIPLVDSRLAFNGIPLNLTQSERLDLEAFMKTLTGSDIYTNEKWSNPFDQNDEITIIGGPLSDAHLIVPENKVTIYPNPAEKFIRIQGLKEGNNNGAIYTRDGLRIWQGRLQKDQEIIINTFPNGIYFLRIHHGNKGSISEHKFIKF